MQPSDLSATCISVYAIDPAKKLILLLRRSEHQYKGIWQMVTGHIQEDEEPTTAALRELKEETDLEAHSLYATEFCDIFYSPISKGIEVMPSFIASVSSSKEVLLNSHEHDLYQWVSLRRAASLLAFSKQIEVIHWLQNIFFDKNTQTPFLDLIARKD